MAWLLLVPPLGGCPHAAMQAQWQAELHDTEQRLRGLQVRRGRAPLAQLHHHPGAPIRSNSNSSLPVSLGLPRPPQDAMATRDKPGGGQSPPQLSRALDAVRGLLAPVGPLAAPAAPQVRLCARIRRWVGASEAGASAATDSLSHARSRARRLPAVAGRGSSSSGHRAPRSVPRGCAQHRNACMHGPDSRVHVRGLASQLGALDAAHTACRPPSRRAAPAKLVRVPVRPRSGRPHAAGSSGWRSVGGAICTAPRP